MRQTRHSGTICTRLDQRTRSLLEHGFGSNLGGVRIVIRRRSPGVLPFTVGDRVVLGEDWYRPDTAEGVYLLAHEVAHLAQKRRGSASTSPASGQSLEAEAHEAAATICAGGRFTCRMADVPAARRFWGEAGHYYTSYLVMLAAGADPDDAFQMATLCQMPDQVDMLDATYMGEMLGLKAAEVAADVAGSRPIQAARDALALVEFRRQVRQVQEGIHALTGGSGAAETQVRGNFLLKATFPSLEFGIGIHSYGDSFAHRQMNGSGKMYKGPLGHLLHVLEDDPNADTSQCLRYYDTPGFGVWDGMGGDPAGSAVLGCTFSTRYLHNPHDPDKLNKRKSLYRDYGLGFFDIMTKKLPSAPRRLPADQVGPKLDSVSDLKDEDLQIARLREIAATDLKVPMDSKYQPEQEGKNGVLTWGVYFRNHQGSGKAFSPDLLVKTQDLARQWTTP